MAHPPRGIPSLGVLALDFSGDLEEIAAFDPVPGARERRMNMGDRSTFEGL